MENFEKSSSNDENKVEKITIPATLREEISSTNNPNISDQFRFEDLTEEDLKIWAQYENYKQGGEGPTLEDFHQYTFNISQQENNKSSQELRAYLADKLLDSWY